MPALQAVYWQSSAEVDPAGAVIPAPQSVQLVDSDGLLLYLPDGHERQYFAPESTPFLDEEFEATLWRDRKLPAPQSAQACALICELYLPFAQSAHPELPEEAMKDPAPHVTQLLSPCALALPAGHALQNLAPVDTPSPSLSLLVVVV